MAADIKPILHSFDAFGWIPTLRGALSLDLMGDSGLMWGDVDKFSVAFSEYTGTYSQRYIAATSFHNVSDSKYGKDYCRSFRYFFYGSVPNNNDATQCYKNLIGDNPDDAELNSIRTLAENERFLLGHLFIVLEETHTLTDLEVSIIKRIKDLVNKKEEYVYQFSYEADSLENLEVKRRQMKRHWEVVKNDIDHLTSQDCKVFHFGVFMTRDGITLLKDLTANESKKLYFEAGTSSDYTANIPIHRIFKTALNFIKYLFHKNYHHEEEHDTFLPVSNLHPFHVNHKFTRIFKHQIDAFLHPIMKLRRQGIKNVNLDSTGIICYAKSFIYVCRNNHLIPKDQADKELEFIALQESEIAHTSRHTKSLINSLASQNNLFFMLSTVLAFMVAALKIYESGMRLSGSELGWLSNEDWYSTVALLVILGAIGYLILFLSTKLAKKKEFRLNKAKSNKLRLRNAIFHKDSDLNNKRLSKSLRLYIWIQNTWNEKFNHGSDRGKGKKGIQIAKIVFWTIMMGLSILGVLWLI